MKKRILSLLLVVSTLFTLTAIVSAEDTGHYTVTDVELFTERESLFADGVATAAANMQESYTFPQPVALSELSAIMNIVYNEYPELFHMESSYYYVKGNDPDTGDTVATKVIFKYSMTSGEYAMALEEMEAWADSVITMGDESFTEEQWALLFHDYLAARYSYDHSLVRNTAYQLIKDEIGVCQAYHLAYMYLLRSVGIECSMAISSQMVHVWTMVKINGNWHHVDALWDDGTEGAWGRATHNYFLLCDHVISDEEGGHYAWIAKNTASCHNHTREDLKFTDTAFVYGDRNWYYMKGGSLYVTDDPREEGTVVADLKLKWHVWDKPTSIYIGTFSGLVFHNDIIFFNGEDRIYSYDTATQELDVFWENDRTDGRIYGFKRIGDEIHINISTTPSKIGTSEVLKLPATDVRPIPGDANGDGAVDAADLQLLQRYIAGLSAEMDNIAADANSDGNIDAADTMIISRSIAGLSI